jgi:hypothetical protein
MQWTDQANCSLSGGALGLSNPSEQTFVSPTGVFSAIFAACDTRFVRVNGWVCYFGYTPRDEEELASKMFFRDRGIRVICRCSNLHARLADLE